MDARKHQVVALDALWEAMQYELNVLLDAPCSFGKTFIISKIIQKLLRENPDFRVLILVDREILVTQTEEKLLDVAPELLLNIGIACTSVSKIKNIDKQITIASRQTLISHLNEFEPVHLVVGDEIHMWAIPKEGKKPDQFGVIINTLQRYNPNVRLLGMTATPYRLNDGYIYGDKNSSGCIPYFSIVHHKAKISDIQDKGYLAPLIGKTIAKNNLVDEIKNIPLIGGEINLGELASLMSNGRHVQSAVETWQEYASDRKKTIVFCVTIAHCEIVCEAFNNASIKALVIHSQQKNLFQAANMAALKNGHGKVFCSVGKLTTGLDVKDIDCILMLRATKSASLFKQMLGRGQRIADGKKDCLALDMVGNNHEFGTNLDDLKVSYKKSIDGKKATSKECPECGKELHPAVRICDCGYEYPKDETTEADKPDMVDSIYNVVEPPVEMFVDLIEIRIHTSRKSGNKLLRIRFELLEEKDSVLSISASHWMCFPEDGYGPYPVRQMELLWKEMTGNDNFPKSAKAAEARSFEILKPGKALVDVNGKWKEIKNNIYDYDKDIPF